MSVQAVSTKVVEVDDTSLLKWTPPGEGRGRFVFWYGPPTEA